MNSEMPQPLDTPPLGNLHHYGNMPEADYPRDSEAEYPKDRYEGGDCAKDSWSWSGTIITSILLISLVIMFTL